MSRPPGQPGDKGFARLFLTLFLKNTIGILLSVIIAFILACLVQSLILVLTGSIKEHELNDYPQKSLLLILGKIAGIYE